MRQLILAGPATVSWSAVDQPPPPGPGAALVRPVAIATCDLDIAVLAGRYPLPGPHADAMLVKLPAGVEPLAVASASDNLPDGWRTVGPQLAAEPGAEVLVVGGDNGPHSIGLYAAGLAVALGAARVTYLDQDPGRLAIAAALGAQVIDSAPPRKAGEFPITVDASGSQEGLRCALSSTAPDGTCTSPSVYLTDQALPLFSMYSRCCTFSTGRAHARPAIPVVLDLVAAGFRPALVTSAVVPLSAAADALSQPPMKLVIDCTS